MQVRAEKLAWCCNSCGAGCVCKAVVVSLSMHRNCVDTPNPSVWAHIGHSPPKSALKSRPQLKLPNVPRLPLMLCFSFWVPSVYLHKKPCIAHVCEPSKMLWFYLQVRGAAGTHCGFLPFFSLPIFFSFVCCPISDLEGQIHGKFISGPTLPNYMMWINVY